MTDAVRVHLADDHTMFREGLAAILSSRGMEVVGETGTGPDAAAAVGNTRPDVVITQLEMRLKDAEEVLSGIRRASPGSKVVVLTMLDNLRYMQAVSRMGIDALLHKSSTVEEVVAVLGATAGSPGGRNAVVALPRALLERLGEEPMGALSERETEVLVLAARGLSNRVIARELHLSEGTVKRHLANIYAKIGTRSRSDAVRTAIVEQWIGIEEITSPDGAHPTERTATERTRSLFTHLRGRIEFSEVRIQDRAWPRSYAGGRPPSVGAVVGPGHNGAPDRGLHVVVVDGYAARRIRKGPEREFNPGPNVHPELTGGRAFGRGQNQSPTCKPGWSMGCWAMPWRLPATVRGCCSLGRR